MILLVFRVSSAGFILLLLSLTAACQADEFHSGYTYVGPQVYSANHAASPSSFAGVAVGPARSSVVQGHFPTTQSAYVMVPGCVVCRPAVVVAHGTYANPVSFAGFAFTSSGLSHSTFSNRSPGQAGHGVSLISSAVVVDGIYVPSVNEFRVVPQIERVAEELALPHSEIAQPAGPAASSQVSRGDDRKADVQVPPVPTELQQDFGAMVIAKETGGVPGIGIPESVDASAAEAIPLPDTTVDIVAKADSKTPEDMPVDKTADAAIREQADVVSPDVVKTKEAAEKEVMESVSVVATDSVDTKTAEVVNDRDVKVSVNVTVTTEKSAKTDSTRKSKNKTNKKSDSTSATKQLEKEAVKLSPVLAWNMSNLQLPSASDCASSSEIVSHGSIRIDDNNGLDLRKGWVSFPSASKMVHDQIIEAGKFSIVARVVCDNDKQDGPARIISNSKNTDERNFMLGQEGRKFVVRIRTSKGDENGTKHETAFGQVKPGKQQDIAVVYDGRKLLCFVDGKEVAQEAFSADFESWKQYPVSAGSEATGKRDWSGRIVSLVVLPTADRKQTLSLLKRSDD